MPKAKSQRQEEFSNLAVATARNFFRTTTSDLMNKQSVRLLEHKKRNEERESYAYRFWSHVGPRRQGRLPAKEQTRRISK